MANQQNDQMNASPSRPVSEPMPTTPQTNLGQTTPTSQTSSVPNATSPETGNKLKDSAADLYEHAKETASDSYDVVATKAKTVVEKQKNQFSTGLKTVADSFRQMGGQLRTTPEQNRLTELTSEYTGKAAGTIENVANYFDRKDPREMIRDVEGFARRNPAIFFGTAFALGLLAARFLKSSKPDEFSRSTNMPIGQPGATALPASTSQPGTGSLPRSV